MAAQHLLRFLLVGPEGQHDFLFFLLDAAWVRSPAERPSVSYTKVSAVSLGLANSCNYTSRNKFKQKIRSLLAQAAVSAQGC